MTCSLLLPNGVCVCVCVLLLLLFYDSSDNKTMERPTSRRTKFFSRFRSTMSTLSIILVESTQNTFNYEEESSLGECG